MHVRPRILRRVLVGIWLAVLAGVFVVTASLKAQAPPTLTLISPADGTTVDGPVTVRVEHSGIIFDGVKIGKAPEPGVGHWHINIDGKYAGLSVSNVVEIPNDAFPTISAGPHTIMVNLHENNHADINPPVQQSITLNFSKDVTLATATGGAPSLKLVDQGQGADNGAPLVVRVEHSGIIFDGVKIGKAPEPGIGHWHINIDGKYAGLSVSNVVEIPNDAFPTISAGPHTIMVNLHENNHADINPPVQEAFQINLSKDLSLGGTAPGAAGAATTAGATGPATGTDAHGGHGAVAMATVTGVGALPNTGAPVVGENGMRLTSAVLAVLACLLLGSLLVYWSRTSLRSHDEL